VAGASGALDLVHGSSRATDDVEQAGLFGRCTYCLCLRQVGVEEELEDFTCEGPSAIASATARDEGESLEA
jgi:hypothetical protein